MVLYTSLPDLIFFSLPLQIPWKKPQIYLLMLSEFQEWPLKLQKDLISTNGCKIVISQDYFLKQTWTHNLSSQVLCIISWVTPPATHALNHINGINIKRKFHLRFQLPVNPCQRRASFQGRGMLCQTQPNPPQSLKLKRVNLPKCHKIKFNMVIWYTFKLFYLSW